MASIIKTRTISAVTETAIQMSNSRFARPVSIPIGWQRIRLGALLHFTDSGADLTSTPTFGMGFCSGTTNILGDASPTHFVGWRTTDATWFRGSINYGAGPMVCCKNVAGSYTDSSNISDGGGGLTWSIGKGAGADTADRCLVFIDLIYGSPNYTFQWFGCTNLTGIDTSLSVFLTQMSLITPSLTNYSINTNSLTVAVDEGTNGILDSINFYWDRTDSLCEICAIAFARLA